MLKKIRSARLVERAKTFSVRPSAICYALKKLKITRKKKNFAIKKEIEKQESNIIEISEN
jgi:putative transposase